MCHSYSTPPSPPLPLSSQFHFLFKETSSAMTGIITQIFVYLKRTGHEERKKEDSVFRLVCYDVKILLFLNCNYEGTIFYG